MNKFKLEPEYDYDFFLVGISCHEKDYRVCWGVNKVLDLDLEKVDDLEIHSKKPNEDAMFALFSQQMTDTEVDYFLISNKTPGPGLLIPEQKSADYFFIARGPFDGNDEDRMLSSLKSISFVLTAFRLDPDSLKSKQNLIF